MSLTIPIPRSYQTDAGAEIEKELALPDVSRCLVKMFCGSGKSLVMYHLARPIHPPAVLLNLVVFVFPTLALLDQFSQCYVAPTESCLKISSEVESTTDPDAIHRFWEQHRFQPKIVCVTYQSFDVLLANLEEDIDLCCFDEAHHAVGETYQNLIFGSGDDKMKKQVFFTATPKNANGIFMYDSDDVLKIGHCGRLVYDYSYMSGLNDGYLNPFEVRVDFSTEDTAASTYESIARAVLASGNGRVLTFHTNVNGDSDTSVLRFVDEAGFQEAFRKVAAAEFPELVGKYKSVSMRGLYASVAVRDRRRILDSFDTTPDDEVIVLCSCETIGEGVDTKNANMCVFVDPKSSLVKIIQNIGRVVRKQKDVWKPASTILLPCWVNRTRYADCGDDKEKCDAVIREDMQRGGNFNSILNVMTALKQEDEEMYNICLHYPHKFSPNEIWSNLSRSGWEPVEEEGCMDVVAAVGDEIENVEEFYEMTEDCGSDEEILARVAETTGKCVEVHSQSLDEPVVRYGDNAAEVIRLCRMENEETGEDEYWKLGAKENVIAEKEIRRLSRNNRLGFKVHSNPDVLALWSAVGVDTTKEISSCVVECEVTRLSPIERAAEIISNGKERKEKVKGGRMIPRQIPKEKQTIPELEQEDKDARKLSHWNQALKGRGICDKQVCDLLDAQMPGWRDKRLANAICDAEDIISNGKERKEKVEGGRMIPRRLREENRTTPELEQEDKDATKLCTWNQALKGRGSKKCPPQVCDLLDAQMPGWRDIRLAHAICYAEDIISNGKERKEKVEGGRMIPRLLYNKEKRTTPELEQEHKDARKLSHWKTALKGRGDGICPPQVCDLLDAQMPGWRDIRLAHAICDAEDIISNGKERKEKVEGGRMIPRHLNNKEKRTTPELEQEDKDARKLSHWKTALKGGDRICPPQVCDLLDAQMPGWRKVPETVSETETDTESTITPPPPPPKKTVIRRKRLLPPTEEITPPSSTEEQQQHRQLPPLSQLHKKYITMRSDNLHTEFQQNPHLWQEYHTINDLNDTTFHEKDIPRNVIATHLDRIQTKRKRQVADLGCGRGTKLARRFEGDGRFEFLNYDHISDNDPTIQSCDIQQLPLEDHSLEIAVMSLVMWGSNCEDHVREAYRVLETRGLLYITEPTKRWTEVEAEPAGRLRNLLLQCGFVVVEEYVEKFALFVCQKM